MKYFAVVLLFAFTAQSFASQDLDSYLLEDDSDRHPFVQCKIDLYDCVKRGDPKRECLVKYKNCMAQLIPTIPPFVIACKDQASQCVGAADSFREKGKCFLELAKCLKNGGPVSPPSGAFFMDDKPGLLPSLKLCYTNAYQCVKDGRPKADCAREFLACKKALLPTLPPMPTIPPYVVACKEDLKQCIKSESGILAKAKCFKAFGKCLMNKGPAAPVYDVGADIVDAIEDGPVPTRRPLFKCSRALKKCYDSAASDDDKAACRASFKQCIKDLIPTPPAFVAKCRADYKACAGGSMDWKKRLQCGLAFIKCLKNKGSS